VALLDHGLKPRDARNAGRWNAPGLRPHDSQRIVIRVGDCFKQDAPTDPGRELSIQHS